MGIFVIFSQDKVVLRSYLKSRIRSWTVSRNSLLCIIVVHGIAEFQVVAPIHKHSADATRQVDVPKPQILMQIVKNPAEYEQATWYAAAGAPLLVLTVMRTGLSHRDDTLFAPLIRVALKVQEGREEQG